MSWNHALRCVLFALLTVYLCGCEGATAEDPGVASPAADAGGDVADAATLDGSVGDAGLMAPVEFKVGVTYIETSGALGRVLPTAIWYPAPDETSGTPELYAGLIGREAVRDAPIADGGPWPLIVFSHGNSGVKEQSVFLMEALAEAGYVVVAPDHVGNTFFNDDESLEPLMNHLRPLDVRAVIDRVTEPIADDPAWLNDRVDLDRIGMTGHSRGGYTTLAIAGGALGPRDDYRQFCADAPDHEVCQRFDPMAGPYDLSDDRVQAALPLSPAAYTLDLGSLATVEVPTFIMTGLLDELTPYQGVVRPLYDALPAPKSLWTLTNGDHYTFSDLCTVYDLLPADQQGMFGQACSANNPLPVVDAHALIRVVAVAFFDQALKGLMDDQGVLSPTMGDEVTLIRAD